MMIHLMLLRSRINRNNVGVAKKTRNVAYDTQLHKDAYNASVAAYGGGKHSDRLRDQGYVEDKELSTHNTKVYSHNNRTILAYRGTTDKTDVGADAELAVGNYKGKEFNAAREIHKRVKAKYGDRELITTGHSLGGTKASIIGSEFGSKAISFNPGTGFIPLKTHGQTVFKTNLDPISTRVQGGDIHQSSGGHSTSNFEKEFYPDPIKGNDDFFRP